jgi:hypothetical protein
MERRFFGLRRVSIQQGQQPGHALNDELWGYQVSLSHVNIRVKIERPIVDV